MSKKQQVLDHFLKHPLAVPSAVSAKFHMAMPAVYTMRKEARARSLDDVAAPQAKDRQVGGEHYKEMGVQPWDVVDTWPREQRIGYYRGGALKYLMRMGSKDESPVEVAKGQHYIQKLLEVLYGEDK